MAVCSALTQSSRLVYHGLEVAPVPSRWVSMSLSEPWGNKEKNLASALLAKCCVRSKFVSFISRLLGLRRAQSEWNLTVICNARDLLELHCQIAKQNQASFDQKLFREVLGLYQNSQNLFPVK